MVWGSIPQILNGMKECELWNGWSLMFCDENFTVISESSEFKDVKSKTTNSKTEMESLSADVFHFKMRSLWVMFTVTARLITHMGSIAHN